MGDDLYLLYDLVRDEKSEPGEMVSFRVRARDEQSARACAAAHAGREGREAWEDKKRSRILELGEAVVQWHGIVISLAHWHRIESTYYQGLESQRP